MKNLEKYNELKKRIKSDRMIAIVEMIEYISIADIGTDHGYIPIFSCLSGTVMSAIGCDIMPGPLSTAAKNIKSFELDSNIKLRLGNGLEAVKPGEAETIIITGMGGKTIIDILTQGQEVVQKSKQLILSPQSNLPNVRKLVHHFGFVIKNEILMKENNRYYHILSCTKGNEIYTEEEYLLGKILINKKSLEFLEYLKNESNHVENILLKPIDYEKRKKLESLLEIYKRNI